jgi:hypothetical protein
MPNCSVALASCGDCSVSVNVSKCQPPEPVGVALYGDSGVLDRNLIKEDLSEKKLNSKET